MNAVCLKDIYKTFYGQTGEVEVINNLSLEVKKGEIVALVGPSGGGKSTILNIIAGLIEVDSGEKTVNGKIGYMFQKDLLFEWRTIKKNILLGKEISKNLTKEDIAKGIDLLSKYELADFIDNFPSELSGGMRQRIALIRTLLTNPDILLLDEPFSALDAQTRIIVSEDVHKTIRQYNLTAILVTHDISEAISMADRVIVLSKRPATIVKEYKIDMNIDDAILRRKSPLFNKYFTAIWDEINEK